MKQAAANISSWHNWLAQCLFILFILVTNQYSNAAVLGQNTGFSAIYAAPLEGVGQFLYLFCCTSTRLAQNIRIPFPDKVQPYSFLKMFCHNFSRWIRGLCCGQVPSPTEPAEEYPHRTRTPRSSVDRLVLVCPSAEMYINFVNTELENRLRRNF